MKNIVFIAVTMLLSIFCISANADTVQKRIVDFDGVKEMVSDIDIAEKTLLILDFQDTTVGFSCDYDDPSVENCPYLGSRAWFNWQLSLLKNESNSEYLVAKDRVELIEIMNVFAESSLDKYVEQSIPLTLDSFAKENVRIMFVTQYGSLHRLVESKAVHMPLNKEQRTSLADIMVVNSPKLNDPLETLAVCNATDKVNINYQNGVLYTAGENISKALHCFVEQYNNQLSELSESESSDSSKVKPANSTVKAEEVNVVEKEVAVGQIKPAHKVVYVNDSYDETEALYNAYRGNKDYDVFSLYYTKPDDLWKPLLADGQEEKLQIEAHKQWLEVKEDTFKKVYFDVVEK